MRTVTRLFAPLSLLAASMAHAAAPAEEPHLTPELIERYIAMHRDLPQSDATGPAAADSPHDVERPPEQLQAAMRIRSALAAAQERRLIATIERQRALVLDSARSRPDETAESLRVLEAALDRDAPIPEPEYGHVPDADVATIAPYERQLWRLFELEGVDPLPAEVWDD